MTRVDFYVLPEGETLSRERVVCSIAGKAFSQGQHLYIHAAGEEQAAALDELLWTFKDISFLPHEQVRGGGEAKAPIAIGWEGPPPRIEVMINLAHPSPDFIERFERVIEVVGHDPGRRQEARERYRHYQKLGYESKRIEIPVHHDWQA